MGENMSLAVPLSQTLNTNIYFISQKYSKLITLYWYYDVHFLYLFIYLVYFGLGCCCLRQVLPLYCIVLCVQGCRDNEKSQLDLPKHIHKATTNEEKPDSCIHVHMYALTNS